jgi:hypothetical protein
MSSLGHGPLYGRFPLAKSRLEGMPHRVWLQFYIRPVCTGRYLLALTEFADPRLIFGEGSKLEGPFRSGGSRSDLFAITLHGTYATSEITLSLAELRDEPT